MEKQIMSAPGNLLQAAEKLVQAQKHSLLLIEDTAAHAAIIRRSLDEAIWQVEHVTRAADALASFQLNPYRIVLLDLSLPDSDGLELMSRLRTINADSPIIVVTATDQVSVSVTAMQKGAWDYVVKSDPKETGQQIVAALDRAWKVRLRAAEGVVVAESRLTEMMQTQRLEVIQSVVNTVCSEINNPLSALFTYCQLLLQKELSPELQRLADGINRAAAQVSEAVQKLKGLNEQQTEEYPLRHHLSAIDE